jgi:hypothetical protein
MPPLLPDPDLADDSPRDLIDRDGVKCVLVAGARPSLVRTFSLPEEAQRELEARVKLERAGFPMLGAPVVSGHAGAIVHTYQLTAGCERLDRTLAREPDRVRSLSLLLGAWFARLHEAGFVLGRAFAWSLLVDRTRGLVPVELRALGKRARLADLGALFASLSLASFSTAARARVLASYVGARAGARARVEAVRAASRRLRAQGIVPRLHPTIAICRARTSYFLAHERLATLLHGQTTTWPLDRPTPSSWVRERTLRDRGDYENLRAEVSVAGDDYTLYLKRYRRDLGAARAEWLNHWRLGRLGLACPVPALVAESGERSVFASFALSGSVPLDLALRDGSPPLARRLVTRELSLLVRRLHAAGLSHRDLYLGHFHVHDGRLHLLDLARVQEWRRLPRHRRVKDLATLCYSARVVQASRSEMARFLRIYVGGGRLARHRRLIRAVQAKSRAIERHAGPPRPSAPEP